MKKRTQLDTRPFRTSITAGLALTGLLTVAVLGYLALDVLRHSREGRSGVNRVLKPPLSPPSSTPYLLAVRSGGALGAVLVVAPSADGSIAPAVVIVPTTTRIEPDVPDTLATAYGQGFEQFRHAASATLGVEFADAFDVERGLVENGGMLDVKVALDELLTGSPASPSALWTDVLSRPFPAIAEGAGAILHEVTSAGPPHVRSLIGRRSADGATDLDVGVLLLTMAEVVPGAVSPSSDRVRFEIRDPFKDQAVRQNLVERLASVGASVIWVHEVNEAPARETRFAYDNPSRAGDVEQYRAVIGEVVDGLTDQPVHNVDIIITIGGAFVESARASSATVSTTTTGST